MKIIARPFSGAALVALERAGDQRGAFMRTFDRAAFADEGWDSAVDHTAESINPETHTLRGIHFQRPPYEDQKIVRCIAGSIFDVAIDLRRGSPTEGKAFQIRLSAEQNHCLILPKGVAHGFLTLEPHTRISYHLFSPYRADAACGLRFDDPDLGLSWPAPPALINERDRHWPRLSELPLSHRRFFG